MPGFQFFSLNPCQVHLIGNVAVWYAGTASLLAYGVLLTVYLLRRRRQCYDIPEGKRGTYCSESGVCYTLESSTFYCLFYVNDRKILWTEPQEHSFFRMFGSLVKWPLSADDTESHISHFLPPSRSSLVHWIEVLPQCIGEPFTLRAIRTNPNAKAAK